MSISEATVSVSVYRIMSGSTGAADATESTASQPASYSGEQDVQLNVCVEQVRRESRETGRPL